MDTVKKSAMAELFGEHSKAIDYLSDLQFSFANLIFSERLKKEKNQTDFAKELGVSQGLLSRWESGDGNFTLKVIAEVADKLRMKPSLSFTPVNALESVRKTKVKVMQDYKEQRDSLEHEREKDSESYCFLYIGRYSENKRGDENDHICKGIDSLWRIG